MSYAERLKSPRQSRDKFNTSFYDGYPCISDSGLALFFVSYKSKFFNADIRLATRQTLQHSFDFASDLTSINTYDEERSPCLSHDGSILYFVSKRGGGSGGYDIWQAPIIPKTGDFDLNDSVDMADFSILATAWGSTRNHVDSWNSLCELYGSDEVIDTFDLGVFAAYWLTEPSLAGYWAMNETGGSTAGDSSGYGRNGALLNMDDGTWVEGKAGNALAFNGVDDQVRVYDYKGIEGGHSRTVCAWIKTSATGAADIVFWGDRRTNYTKWKLFAKGNWSGELSVGIGGGNVIGTTNVCDGAWHHVAAVLADDGSPDVTEVRLYVDGVEEAISKSKSAVVDTSAYSDVLIGSNGVDYFDGLIDEVRIYDRGLYKNEIRELIGLDPVPEGVWSFDDGSGASASDSSGSGRDGTLVNMDDSDWVEGEVGDALEFDGVNDFVRVEGYKGILGGGSRTVCAWIRTSTLGVGDIVYWGDGGSSYAKWDFFARGDIDGKLGVGVRGGNVFGTTNVCDGVWHHVAAVLENDGTPDVAEVRLYVDGVEEVISKSKPAVVNTLPGSDVLIGSNGATYFDGLIDEVRIYDRALGAEEIAELAR